MCIRYLGLVLIWLPAGLRAQSEAWSCAAPVLVHGLFTPKQDIYSHGAKLTYTCNNGHKPADQGWWATSACNNGLWSPPPQCIDESSCVQPDVNPNTRYSPSPTGWYENGGKIQIRCDKGYETENNILTGTCINGDWSSMPVCEKRTDSCSEPPHLPHAVIINQTHQEVFAADSEVMYQCEDGYTTEQGESRKSVTCISGNWTEGPTCKQSDTAPAIRPVKPDSSPMTMPVYNCGNLPHIPHSAVIRGRMALTYSCADNYKLSGSETVVCYNDGTWSETPTCEAEGHCVLDPAQYPRGYFIPEYPVQHVADGETRQVQCRPESKYYTRIVTCKNGILDVNGYCCFDNGILGIC
ncbi:complement factor H-related protein 1-like isoform X2 [Betta splendens]|uniref:Complement factor H-related protein 1-like isoform X2 n=1 Tax=Betta splendens TaxID=158456 RepID=A0A6P7L4N8_BETSP|nr:complement factor H-related protein 1-like isoform X2 [Betta splendens]